MSIIHLYDNTVGPPGNGGSPYGGGFELGIGFIPSLGVGVTGLRWFAMNTTVTDKPSALTIWDQPTATALATTSNITHSGTSGWYTVNLPTTVVLVAGRRYVVSATFPGGTTVGAISTVGAAPTPLAWDGAAPKVQSAFGTVGVMPTNASTYYWWVDVEVDTAAGGGAGAGPSGVDAAALEAKMVAWFASTSDNTHQTALPWTTKTAVDAVKTTTDRINNLSNGAITWLNDRSSQLTDFLNGVNSGAVAALNNLASRITGSGAGGGSAFYGSGGTQVAQAAEDVLALVQLLAALERNALVDFPSAPWVQTDTTAFDTSLAWAVEADLYAVNLTGLGGGIVNLDADGVDVSYRLAWWCPLIGSAGQQRRFIDFPASHLWLDGQRMPGLLLHSPKGATGSVQAWTYD